MGVLGGIRKGEIRFPGEQRGIGGLHLDQPALNGACAYKGGVNGFRGLAQALLRLFQRAKSFFTAPSSFHTSLERCSMARERKPICREFSSAAKVEGPATTTR